MKIGELATRFGIATSKVRFLESRGLVRARRLASGYRDYDEDAAEMLELVLRAQDFGFSLDEIAKAFAEAPGRRPSCEVLPAEARRQARRARPAHRAVVPAAGTHCRHGDRARAPRPRPLPET